MKVVTRSLVVALTAVVAACGGRAEMEEAGPGGVTMLEVDNQSNLDMTIYALPENGPRVRLGTATAHMRSRFEIPSDVIFGITAMRFQGDPIGSGRTPVSQTITVSQGETLEMRIPPY